MMHIGKKFLFLFFFTSSALVGMDIALNKENCSLSTEENIGIFSIKGAYPLTVTTQQETCRMRLISFFNRPINSVTWDDAKNDVLHIQFKDNNVFVANVNQLRYERVLSERLDDKGE